MKVACLNCGHEFDGNVKEDSLGSYCECEECGSTFDVNEAEEPDKE